MNNIIKKALEQNGISVDYSDVDNVIFSNDKTDLFHLEISEGCYEDKRLLFARLYESAEEFKNSKEFIDENYFEGLRALKETHELSQIDLYSFVKSLFELINVISTKEEMDAFLEDVNQEWLFYENRKSTETRATFG